MEFFENPDEVYLFAHVITRDGADHFVVSPMDDSFHPKQIDEINLSPKQQFLGLFFADKTWQFATASLVGKKTKVTNYQLSNHSVVSQFDLEIPSDLIQGRIQHKLHGFQLDLSFAESDNQELFLNSKGKILKRRKNFMRWNKHLSSDASLRHFSYYFTSIQKPQIGSFNFQTKRHIIRNIPQQKTPLSKLENFVMHFDTDKALFAMVEGSSLLGNGKLTVHQFSHDKNQLQPVAQRSFDLKQLHIGDLFVTKRNHQLSLFATQWLDEERTITAFHPDGTTKHYGRLKAQSSLIFVNYSHQQEKLQFAIKERSGNNWNFLLCQAHAS